MARFNKSKSDAIKVGVSNMLFNKKDLQISFFKSSGPGGQKKNKTESAVRIRHLPTGIIVTAVESRSRNTNLERAFERLSARLKTLQSRPVPRIPTRPGQGARERRLNLKQHRSGIKRERKGGGFSED
jgi:protein subunit release factor B